MKLPALGAVAAVLWTTGPAGAVDADPSALPARSGLELGARVGVAHPAGSLGAGPVGTTPYLGGVAPGLAPLGVDAGYRVSPWTYLGATLAWAPVVGQAEQCPACNFRYDFQARAEVRFYFAPSRSFDPWLSLGAGWEVLHLALGQSVSGSSTYDGPVAGDLQFGIDVRTRAFAIGPYAGASMATFLRHSLDPAPPGETTSVPSPSLHGWFTFGLRVTYGPWPPAPAPALALAPALAPHDSTHPAGRSIYSGEIMRRRSDVFQRTNGLRARHVEPHDAKSEHDGPSARATGYSGGV